MSAALLALAVGGVQAQVYVGGNLGLSKVDIECPVGVRCDTNDIGYKAYVGFKDPSNQNFSVEGGYLDLGKAKAEGARAAEFKARAFFLAAALHGNFTPSFGGGGRAGLAYVKTSCTGTVNSFSGSVDQTYLAAYVGGNLDYALTRNLKAVVALDVTRAKCPAAVDLPSATVGLLSLGAQYDF
ncbi:outer membrane beta-barrel protein [Aquabacterium sp.]|uniref:outer membrane beta-barrel protein n=1 Tax=Aquabacterium sp. TaxID=1872578 RepID=UPI003D6D7173